MHLICRLAAEQLVMFQLHLRQVWACLNPAGYQVAYFICRQWDWPRLRQPHPHTNLGSTNMQRCHILHLIVEHGSYALG